MDIDKEIELMKLKVKELELKKELEEIKEEKEGKELIPIKIPEIIKIPIIIPECPPKPCPKRVNPCPNPYTPGVPILIVDPTPHHIVRPYVGDIIPDPTIVICETSSTSTGCSIEGY